MKLFFFPIHHSEYRVARCMDQAPGKPSQAAVPNNEKHAACRSEQWNNPASAFSEH
jgi:hypothetical protein